MIKYLCKRTLDVELEVGFEFYTENFTYSRENGYSGDIEEVTDLENLRLKNGTVSILEVEVKPEHSLGYVSELCETTLYVNGFTVLKEYPIYSYSSIKDIFVQLSFNVQNDIYEEYSLLYKLALLNKVNNIEDFINIEEDIYNLRFIKQLLAIKKLDIMSKITNKKYIKLYNTSLLVNSTIDLNNLFNETNLANFSSEELSDIVLNANVINHKGILSNKVFLKSSSYYLFVSLVLELSNEITDTRKYLDNLYNLLKLMSTISDIDYNKISFVKEVYYYTLSTILEQVDFNIDKLKKDKEDLLKKKLDI